MNSYLHGVSDGEVDPMLVLFSDGEINTMLVLFSDEAGYHLI
jgi:hypothetical protein